ncbi:MAG: T9SS type A sorting domain-containing protein, partial [Ignavibacteria bacterium]|nr:T9SS type A sorting domain-containing protein [Ignavibacteria bacterium]
GADYLSVGGGATVDVTYKLIITDVTDDKLTANTYNLQQNYPNPFNPTTVIQYALPYESNVNITVYNTLGQVVKTFNEGTKQTGSYNVNFNGEGLSSGIYLYNINAVSINGKQNFQATKKMILIK